MPPQLSITKEFGHAYEDAERRRMRVRLLWYLGVSLTINFLEAILTFGITMLTETEVFRNAMDEAMKDDPNREAQYSFNSVTFWTTSFMTLPPLIAYAWGLVHVARRKIDRKDGLRLAYWIIVAPNAFVILSGLLIPEIVFAIIEDSKEAAEAYQGALGWGGALTLFFSHFFACVFLPWTARESIKPMLPLIALNTAVACYASWGDWVMLVVVVVLTPLLMVPGTLLCWFKHSRFRRHFTHTMLHSVYGEMKHELSAARQIHDAMFPDPITEGPVRVEYRYEPMRQIGGDYVFVREHDGTGLIDVVLIDVTGHGVSAALTVNRLHGEVHRLLAEDAGSGPGDLLTGLNRYLHVTLASHSVYATAFCLRVDPREDRLTYANAGHPPAFLLRSGEDLQHLHSTTFLLGVCADEDFVPDERSLHFGAGDRLLAYTDGATEALDEQGRQLRVQGLARLVTDLPRDDLDVLEHVISGVEAHREGPATDDTLVIEISRPKTV